MEIVLNSIFQTDITEYIIKLAKKLYKQDRLPLYSLIYQTTILGKRRGANLYKFKSDINLSNLYTEVSRLSENKLLDYNTIDKIVCCLAFTEYITEYVEFFEHTYTDKFITYDYKLSYMLQRIYKLLNNHCDISTFKDYISIHRHCIVNTMLNSPFYR